MDELIERNGRPKHKRSTMQKNIPPKKEDSKDDIRTVKWINYKFQDTLDTYYEVNMPPPNEKKEEKRKQHYEEPKSEEINCCRYGSTRCNII